MQSSTFLLLIIGLILVAYHMGLRRALSVAGPSGARGLHSLPSYYGWLAAVWCGIPALLLWGCWLLAQDQIISQWVMQDLPAAYLSGNKAERFLVLNDIQNLAANAALLDAAEPTMQQAAERYIYLQRVSSYVGMLLVMIVAIGGIVIAHHAIQPKMRARERVEGYIKAFLLLSSTVAILTTVGIVLSVLFESIRFFQLVPITDFLFGLNWSPQIAIREDQQGASGAFGAIPLFAGTLLISAIAMLVAVPIGLASAIYLAEYADKKLRAIIKPLLEVLAGIPTVVYGVFAALTVAPCIRGFGASIGLDVASESALAAGLVMGIMIIPFVSSLSDDVINAVPQSLRDGAYALGSTPSETIKQVVIPAALPGIVGGILLAISRAIGETMIVVMAAGLAANLTINPLEAVTTVTVQIVTLLVGDQEFDSAKTLAAFALGLMLFIMTLCLNVIALHIVRKYREQYE